MKRLLVVLMLVMMISSICYAKEFTDLKKNHWAYPVIQEMTNEGILNGYPDGTFNPDGKITRAEFAKILTMTFELEKHKTWPYVDVDRHWANSYIEKADWYMRAGEGVEMPDLPDGAVAITEVAFCPDMDMTRELAALAVVKASNLQDETPDLSVLKGFKDNNAIKNYRDYVAIAVAHGFMKGNADGTFNPRGALTRAEVCQLLYNVSTAKEPQPEPTKEPTKVPTTVPTTEPTKAPTLKTMTESDFATSFLKEENKGKNLIYSPLSIKYALKMLGEGADGDTKTQIERVVGGLGITTYENIPDVLSLANGLYIRDAFKDYVKEEYINLLSSAYQAEIKFDSFQTVDAINAWIENKTFGLLKNVLQPGSLTPETVMALMNALAIQMDWDHQFSTENTGGRDFTKEDGTKITATMMHKNAVGDSDAYYIDDKVTALRMDLKKYDNVQLEFIALMPTDKTLTEYAKTFSLEELNQITNQMKTKNDFNGKIVITIPKFEFAVELEKFEEDLQKLGITDAFSTARANFEKMSDIPLSVDEAIHKAMIDFSEKGIKAAAVTVFLMRANSAFIEPEEIVYVTLDKPFLFVIRDKDTKETWFIGTMYEPNLWEKDKEEYSAKF